MVRVVWTSQSLNDIDNIAEFIAKDSLKFAKIQVERFFQAVKPLEEHPKMGRLVPEVVDENLRELLLGSYRIIYRIENDDLINIITVHHSKRLLSNNPNI